MAYAGRLGRRRYLWPGLLVLSLLTGDRAAKSEDALPAATQSVVLPPIHVVSHKPTRHRARTGPAHAPPAQLEPTPSQVAAALSVISTIPFNLPASLDKTGTPIGNVPRSIQVVAHQLFERQGARMLDDTLRDVSGAGRGGQYAFGFYDRIFIRGFDANFLNDGLPDSTSDLTGIPDSLTGVERVEVLKGPGSALYGSSEPGGTINIVHFLPTSAPSASLSEEFGSFGTTTTDFSANGATSIPNLDARVDGRYEQSDGFRGQSNQIAELIPALRWRPAGHDIVVRLELRKLDLTPDAAGIPFSPPKGTGLPLPVPSDFAYYTPFATADQDIGRLFVSDAWSISPILTVNSRAAFINRSVDLLRNAGGSDTFLDGEWALTKPQLRQQHDDIDDFVYEFEPTWKFSTGSVAHTLVTGADVRRVDVDTSRQTADLPNIANIYAPVVPEQSLGGLTFLCDAGHSCYNDQLWARYYGVYLIDQMDVTKAWKVRVSARQDWFTTAGEAITASPTNPGKVYPCVTIPTGCPAGAGNVDEASFFAYTVKGWEADLAATPTDRWAINANLTLQDPRITDYPQTPANVGNFVPSVASVLANASVTYAYPVARPQWGPLRASLGVRYRNGEYADAGDTRDVPGAVRFDAALEQQIHNVTWRLGINNIFNRVNYLYAAGTGGGAFPGPGRTAFLRATATW